MVVAWGQGWDRQEGGCERVTTGGGAAEVGKAGGRQARQRSVQIERPSWKENQMSRRCHVNFKF